MDVIKKTELNSANSSKRRKCDRLVADGRVCINGVVAVSGDRMMAPDEVTLDGRPFAVAATHAVCCARDCPALGRRVPNGRFYCRWHRLQYFLLTQVKQVHREAQNPACQPCIVQERNYGYYPMSSRPRVPLPDNLQLALDRLYRDCNLSNGYAEMDKNQRTK